MRTAIDNYNDTNDAIRLLLNLNGAENCEPDYACSLDRNSPCEIRGRACDKLRSDNARYAIEMLWNA